MVDLNTAAVSSPALDTWDPDAGTMTISGEVLNTIVDSTKSKNQNCEGPYHKVHAQFPATLSVKKFTNTCTYYVPKYDASSYSFQQGESPMVFGGVLNSKFESDAGWQCSIKTASYPYRWGYVARLNPEIKGVTNGGFFPDSYYQNLAFGTTTPGLDIERSQIGYALTMVSSMDFGTKTVCFGGIGSSEGGPIFLKWRICFIQAPSGSKFKPKSGGDGVTLSLVDSGLAVKRLEAFVQPHSFNGNSGIKNLNGLPPSQFNWPFKYLVNNHYVKNIQFMSGDVNIDGDVHTWDEIMDGLPGWTLTNYKNTCTTFSPAVQFGRTNVFTDIVARTP